MIFPSILSGIAGLQAAGAVPGAPVVSAYAPDSMQFWLVVPFVLLLLLIATGPLLYQHFWERHYRSISLSLGAVVAAWYAVKVEGGPGMLEHTLEEYLSFITLISALFVVSGGIQISVGRLGSPSVNVLLLLAGAVLSNLVGTTGASILLIRPYLRINEGRLKAFHIVFFIFIVSNIGGALTPVGDPPLFLGFLRGVPFFWVIRNLWLPWLIALVVLCLVFAVLDTRAGKASGAVRPPSPEPPGIRGVRNIAWLGVVIFSVFLDPAVIRGFPDLRSLTGMPFGVRELVLVVVSVLAYRFADREALRENRFNFEPLMEVAFLFIGIFATMIPALQLIGTWSHVHAAELSVTRLFWGTGLLSGFLDNAPTYLNFMVGASGKFGVDTGSVEQVRQFASGLPSPVAGDADSRIYLMAVSLAAVFFGAMTYIGNAPNFMIRNIALQAGADTPGFVEYIVKYAIPILLPLFTLVWLLFFNW